MKLLTFPSAVAVLAAAFASAALLPGAARADDAGLAGTMATWSLKISAPAETLKSFSSSTTPAQALKASNRLSAVASQAKLAIARQTASSAKGRNLKPLGVRAFGDFAQSGNLLASAIRGLQAGEPNAQITAKVNKAVRLAKEGSTRLTRAAKIIPQLV